MCEQFVFPPQTLTLSLCQDQFWTSMEASQSHCKFTSISKNPSVPFELQRRLLNNHFWLLKYYYSFRWRKTQFVFYALSIFVFFRFQLFCFLLVISFFYISVIQNFVLVKENGWIVLLELQILFFLYYWDRKVICFNKGNVISLKEYEVFKYGYSCSCPCSLSVLVCKYVLSYVSFWGLFSDFGWLAFERTFGLGVRFGVYEDSLL